MADEGGFRKRAPAPGKRPLTASSGQGSGTVGRRTLTQALPPRRPAAAPARPGHQLGPGGASGSGADRSSTPSRAPLEGIDLYLRTHDVQVWTAIASHLDGVAWPELHPDLEWQSWSVFARAVAAQLRSDAPLDRPELLHNHVFPANHRDVLRLLLPVMTPTWLPGIGRALGELVEDAVRASLRRLAPRYAAVAEHDPRQLGTVEYPQLVKSHPMDRPVAVGLVRRGAVSYLAKVNKPDRATAPRALRRVELSWQGSRDRSLWNWVRAEPADASVEEVAASLYATYSDRHPGESGSIRAYGLTPAPPLFGVPPSWARTFRAAAAYAPPHALDETDRGARLVALAESTTDDDIAVAQARFSATRPPSSKPAELAAVLGDSLIAARYLHRTLAPWNQARATDAVVRWIVDRQARIATMDAGELGTWAPVLAEQKDRLQRIASGVQQVTEQAAGMGIKDAGSAQARPIGGLLASYAQAAALSHLTVTSEQLIADAAQQQRQLAITMLRGVTNDMTNAVAAAAGANQHGIWALATEADQITAESRSVQAGLATAGVVDSAAIDETTLRAHELTFRARIEGLFWAVRALRQAADEAGDGLAAGIAKQFHGRFKALERALEPVEGTITRIAANLSNEDDSLNRGSWDDPAERRAQRRIYLKNNQRLLDELTRETDLVEFFRQGASTVQWQRFATACVKVLALVGIAFVASAAGGLAFRAAHSFLMRPGATQAVAEIASGGSLLGRAGAIAAHGTARLAGVAVDAGINAAGEVAIQGGSPGEAFAVNLLATLGSNALLGQLTRDLPLARSIEVRTARLWAKVGRTGAVVLKEAVKLTAHTVLSAAIGYVAHLVVRQGRVTPMQTRDWLLQGLSVGLGRYVGGYLKIKRPSHDKLARIPEVGGPKLLGDGRALAQLAHTAETRPSGEIALELLARRKQLIEDELRMLEAIEQHPELLRAHPDAGITRGELKASLSSARAELGALASHSRQLALFSAGLEEVVPGLEYRGSAEQVKRAIETARRIGLPLGPPHKVGAVTRIAIGDGEVFLHEGAATSAAPPARSPAERFVDEVRASLAPDEQTKLAEMVGKRRSEDFHREYNGDVVAARRQVAAATARAKAAEAAAIASTVKAEQIRKFAESSGMMKDPRVGEIVRVLEQKLADAHARKAATMDQAEHRLQDEVITRARGDAVASLRSHAVGVYMQAQLAAKFPGSRVRRDVQVWQEQDPKYRTVVEFETANKSLLGSSNRGIRAIPMPEGMRVFLEVSDIDLVVTMDRPGAKAVIVHNEELKTGLNDRPKPAGDQLDRSITAIERAGAGGARVRLFEAGKDITEQIDLGSIRHARASTRGPEGKGFQDSLGATAKDLEAMAARMLDTLLPAR